MVARMSHDATDTCHTQTPRPGSVAVQQDATSRDILQMIMVTQHARDPGKGVREGLSRCLHVSCNSAFIGFWRGVVVTR